MKVSMPYSAAAAIACLESVAERGQLASEFAGWLVVQSELYRAGCDDLDEHASFCRSLLVAQFAIWGAPIPSPFASRGEA